MTKGHAVVKALLVGATRHIAAQPLRENGFAVAEAWTAAEALSRAQSFAPDIVLVGDAVARAAPELCSRLRSLVDSALAVVPEGHPQSPSQDVQRASAFGAHALLRPSPDDRELLAAVRVLLRARRMRGSAAEMRPGAAFDVAAHRIRNPLASLVVASSLLRADETLGEHARKLVETAARNVHDVSRCIEALLDAGHLLGESPALVLSPADLRDIVRSAITTPGDPAEGPPTASLLPSEAMIVLADAERLGLALRHLVASARASGRTAAEVEMSRRGDEVSVTVRTDGAGLSPWDGAVDLGVSLARHVIGQHGGELGLDGQTVSFQLELQPS